MHIRLNEQEVTPKLIEALVDKDRVSQLPKDEKNRDYYEGDHDIKNRTFDDKTKPNNKIVTNFCKYITDIYTGYFIGEPISYSSENEEYMERLQEIFDDNDEQNVNARLAKYASIYNRAAEIVYAENEEGMNERGERTNQLNIKFDVLNPEEQRVIFVYDTSIDANLFMAIRWFDHEDVLTRQRETHAYVYTDTQIFHFINRQNGYELQDERPHYFGEVPINPYYNKGEDSKGDFEDIITLNDAYNLLQSDDINESNYSNDAYLVLIGMTADDEDVREMKERRVIELSEGEGADVRWLTKDINDAWKENLKTRLQRDIHKVSAAPDLSDENFGGNSTGVAIEYKLKAFEDNRAAKERSFKKSLYRRIRLISNVLNVQGNNFDPADIQIKFSKNLPQDDAAMVNQATQLLGTRLVSRKTLRSFIPWVEDPAKEEERLESEEDEYTIQDAIEEEENEQ
ncbi:phage portal protein, SPP1 family [Alteribacillus persepolensis]|uniref:Phage portal protein, SPP1 family n=1 Tax=Alteribacillus persepolensis TaxID=568899 RepID=A0A1G8IA13_9BACI|nr:phage portal protein [Alteribacillus persepolensis]SDI15724.1 phage portal protein, SPP1 family [Alteribacillus persepolensis]